MIEQLEERKQKPSHIVQNLKANGLAGGEKIEKTMHASIDEVGTKPKNQDLVLTEDEDQEGSIEDQIEDEDQEGSNEDQKAEQLFSRGVAGGAVEKLDGFVAGGQAGNRSMMSGGRRRRYNVYEHIGFSYQQAYSV